MNEAIKLAIEKGGYKAEAFIGEYFRYQFLHGAKDIALNSIFDDPLFWSALGKVLGWTKYTFGQWKGEPWLVASMRYFKVVMTGGDTDKFWEELLAGLKDQLT